MSDAVGILDLPVAAPTVSPPQERDAAPGDPALAILAAFVASVLQADVADAWAALSPGKPDQTAAIDGTLDGSGPVRHAWFSDPRRGHFSPEDLPGIFVYRAAQATGQWVAADAQRLRRQVVIAWVMPHGEENSQRRERDPFANAVLSALHVAFTQRRHSAWVLASDLGDPDGLKTSFVTSASAVDVTSFDGALASAALKTARPVTITTAAAVGAYNTTDAIAVTGTLGNGLSHTESVYLTEADGGETVKTIFPFATVTEVALPAMPTTGGALTIGYGDSPDARKGSLIQRACGFRVMQFTRATTGAIQVEMPNAEREPFDAIELFLDVAEDSAPDPALRGFAPWDIEAHGTREHPSDDVFEFVIQD